MKPRIAITSGDPAGIGPEVAARAAADSRVLEVCEPLLYGPPGGTAFVPGVLSARPGAPRTTSSSARWTMRSERGAGDRHRALNKEHSGSGVAMEWPHRPAGSPDRVEPVAMMFHSEVLRCVLATVHIALADVPRALTAASLEARSR